MKLESESAAMRFARALGQDWLAWSLRRLHVPVPASALVLEVGSGGNPYPRANVLLDAYLNTRERHYQRLVVDRPTVLARVERMPFRDKAFDFVIASHVLEHSDDPEAFVAELQRVARAGYIETPHAILERLCPYLDHRLELSVDGDVLVARRKGPSVERDIVASLAEDRLKPSRRWNRLLRLDPFQFHVRYYWSNVGGGVALRLLDREKRYVPPEGGGEAPDAPMGRETLRQVVVGGIRRMATQGRRNRSIDLAALLRCERCSRTNFRSEANRVVCEDCGSTFGRASPLLLVGAPSG